jgi:hypothetical protein
LIKKIHPRLHETKFVQTWLFTTIGDKKKTETGVNANLVKAVEIIWAEDMRAANKQVTLHTMHACIILAS